MQSYREFIQRLVVLLQQKAEVVRGAGAASISRAVLDLAAHLFAACSYLQEQFGDVNCIVGDRQPCRRLEESLEQIVKLDRDEAPWRLFGLILEALLGLEEYFEHFDLNDPLIRESIPKTELTELKVGEYSLSGFVLHWLRPTSRFNQLLNMVRGELDVPPMRYNFAPIDSLQRLGMYWDRGEVPRVRPVQFEPPHGVEATLLQDSGPALLRGEFRIALCPMAGPFHPRFMVQPKGHSFTIDPQAGMAGADALIEHVRRVLEAARESRCHLVVLPELMVDIRTREYVCAWLAQESHPIMAVIAGSYHVWSEGERVPVNELTMFDDQGRPLLSHLKGGAFRIRADLAIPPLFPGGIAPVAGATELYEGIRYGAELSILDTSLGRLAVIICADGLDEGRSYISAVERARPDLLIIVAMSEKSAPFMALAERLERLDIGTLFVNADCVVSQAGLAESVLAFARLPLTYARGGNAPPAYVRWLKGRAEPEWFMFGARGVEPWRPLAEHPSGQKVALTDARGSAATGVFMLHDGLGMVFDLGVHWRFATARGHQGRVLAMRSGRRERRKQFSTAKINPL